MILLAIASLHTFSSEHFGHKSAAIRKDKRRNIQRRQNQL